MTLLKQCLLAVVELHHNRRLAEDRLHNRADHALFQLRQEVVRLGAIFLQSDNNTWLQSAAATALLVRLPVIVDRFQLFQQTLQIDHGALAIIDGRAATN